MWSLTTATVLGGLAMAEPVHPSAHQALLAQHARAPTPASREALLEAARSAAEACNARRKAGAYPQAVPRCGEALGLTEAALGPDHPEVATALQDLAAVHRAEVGG